VVKEGGLGRLVLTKLEDTMETYTEITWTEEDLEYLMRQQMKRERGQEPVLHKWKRPRKNKKGDTLTEELFFYWEISKNKIRVRARAIDLPKAQTQVVETDLELEEDKLMAAMKEATTVETPPNLKSDIENLHKYRETMLGESKKRPY